MSSCALEPVWLDTRSSGSRPNRCSNTSQLCAHFTLQLHLFLEPIWSLPPLNWLLSHLREARTRPDHLQNTSETDQYFNTSHPACPLHRLGLGSPPLNRLHSHLREARKWPGTSLVRLKQWYLIHYPKGASVPIKNKTMNILHHTWCTQSHNSIMIILSIFSSTSNE